MRTTHRRLTTAGLLTVAALALGACGTGPRSTATDTSALPSEITSVRVDLESGSVSLRGSDDVTEASVERTLDHTGPAPEGQTHRIEDGVLVLSGCGSRCSVDYSVDLPAGLPVTGATSHGTIHLTATGDVDVRTSNGSIILEDVDAKIVARTSNGTIKGTGLGGTEGIDVETSNGPVLLSLTAPQDVRAATGNGIVRLTVPDGSYRIDASTDRGGTDVTVPNDPDGTFHLDVSSSNGRVMVTRD